MKCNLKSLHTKSEDKLAAYQRKQIGNICSYNAIIAGIKLLLNFDVDPMAFSQEINRLWWQGRFMHIAPNWAVTHPYADAHHLLSGTHKAFTNSR